MPKRSLEDLPAGPIRDLGLPGRAVAALTRAGIVRTEELAVLTRRELAAIEGVGPGMIAAIRRVVPEPPTGIRPAASPQAAAPGRAASGGDPAGDQGAGATEDDATKDDATEDDTPAAPVMPSFASLRAPQRRTALDLLMPDADPEAPEPETPEPTTRPAPAAGPRPPDYADLLALGVHVVRAAIAVPVRLALWSVRAPVHSLRRLLGR
jgi:hypothetical protein